VVIDRNILANGGLMIPFSFLVFLPTLYLLALAIHRRQQALDHMAQGRHRESN
jgi:hypothetical protein